MKYFLTQLFIIVTVMGILSGCAYYSKMAVPVDPDQSQKYQIVEHVKKISFRNPVFDYPNEYSVGSSANAICD